MAGEGRYIVTVENDSPGATNPALQTHWIGSNTSTAQDEVIAQIIAFTQYQYCAVNTRITGIDFSTSPTGGTLPVVFPTVAYGNIQTFDATLNPMTAYGVAFGNSTLAVLGAGAVISKRTTTPGRTGRGRLTTPWLSQNGVTASGSLNALTQAAILDGWNCYMKNIGVGTRYTGLINLNPYVNSSTGDHLITAVTVSSRLGRLRSRTA